MKKFLFGFIGLLTLVACERADNVYTCGKYTVEINLDETGEKLIADLNGDVVEMNITPSANGARYIANLNDTEISLWNHGRDWILVIGDEESIECK